MPRGVAETTCGDHGGHKTSGEPCGRAEGWGTDFDSGKCKFHRGTSADGSSHDNIASNEKHGLKADTKKWFDRHRDEVEDDVRVLVESYIEDAPFGFENTAKVDKLTELCIDQIRLREANEWLREEFLKEETVSVTDDGRPIKKLVENPAHMPRDRIKRTNLKGLKELGILDDPESQKAEAQEDLASLWAQELRE